MKKRIWLGLLTCLVLFLSFMGCDSKLPTSPDFEVLPVINYFHATPSQISVGEHSTLSWSVHVAGFTMHHILKVSISNSETIEVAGVGTMNVYPKITTVYKLIANIGGNSVSEFVTIFVGF